MPAFRHIGWAEEQPTKAPIINNMPIVKILVFIKIQMVKIYVKRNIAQFVKTFNIKYTNFVTFTMYGMLEWLKIQKHDFVED